MSIYLTRTLLLSLGISIFLTVCFHVLRKDLKLSPAVVFDDPKETYSAVFTIRANGYPGETGLQQQFKNSMQLNIAATTERLDKAGYDGKVNGENDSSYTVSARNITDTSSIDELLTGNGNLSFNEVYTVSDLREPLKALQKEWPKFAMEKVVDTINLFFATAFREANQYENSNGLYSYDPYLGHIHRTYADRVFAMLADSAVSRSFPANLKFAIGEPRHNDGMSAEWLLLYALKRNPDPISSKNIVEAHAETDHLDNPYVSLLFDAAGARRWERITERNVGKAIAISINDKVIVAPNVMQKITGGNSRISMSGEENCRVVSVLLTSSELKLPVQIIQSQVKQEGKFSPKVLTGYIKLYLCFHSFLCYQLLCNLVCFQTR